MGPRLGLEWADAALLNTHGGEANVGTHDAKRNVIQIICNDFAGRNSSCILR